MTRRKAIYVRLTNSSRDRIIDAWLDSVATDPDIKVSEIIKEYLYRVALGQDGDPETQVIIDVIRSEFARLPAMIRVQGVQVDNQTTGDDGDAIESALASMPD